MSELTIEQKAQRYDEALNKARDLYMPSDSALLEEIFPELTESEDERIRKAIKQHFLYLDDSFPDKAKWIAWLEKQGQVNETIISQHENKICKENNDSLTSEDEKIRKAIHIYLDWLDGRKNYMPRGEYTIRDMLAWLKKQGEKPQGKSALEAIKEEKVDNADKVEPKDYNSIDPHFGKPADKVEPKFKIGDFIVNDYCMGRIVEITNDAYLLDTGQGIPISCRSTRLWDVTKDAKDGDVLYSPCLSLLWIFKSIDTVYCGCNLNYNDGAFCGEGYIERPTDAIPATKEQRNTLMKAMTDAGWEFDFDKKELKKIENEIEIPFGTKDSELKEATYYIPIGFHAEIDDNKVVIKKGKKPTAWSEEDEERIKNILSVLDVQVCWDGATGKKGNPYQKEINWLKFLKPQKQWKPSDKQMEALKEACVEHWEPDGLDPLYTLYQELKKLWEK